MPTTKKSNEHHYAVIMAGGSGTRLWPMSRRNIPKQFQALFDNKRTMIQLMYDLLRELLPADRIFVQTDGRFSHLVEQQLPDLFPHNVIIEPEARDTAPAFGYAALAITKRDPDAIMGIFYSDHIINSPAPFLNAAITAYESAQSHPDQITMVGVKPRSANTELGYIQIDKQVESYDTGEVFSVEKFIEKPDAETAETLFKSWEYFWNTGYKVCRADHLIGTFSSIDKEISKIFKQIEPLMGKDGEENAAKLLTLYQQLPKISFEYLVTQQAKKLLVVPADIEWSDIGDWKTLHEVLSARSGHHIVSRGNHIGVSDENLLVYNNGEHMVATLGLQDVIVVNMEDVTLVANKNNINEMKTLINQLVEQNKHTYL